MSAFLTCHKVCVPSFHHNLVSSGYKEVEGKHLAPLASVLQAYVLFEDKSMIQNKLANLTTFQKLKLHYNNYIKVKFSATSSIPTLPSHHTAQADTRIDHSRQEENRRTRCSASSLWSSTPCQRLLGSGLHTWKVSPGSIQ